MLKALGIFVRLICSLLVLLAVALYLQTGIDNISPEQFTDTLSAESICPLFTSFNWVSITAAALVVLALLRILDMAWNVAFCLSFVPVIFCGLYAYFGESVALPVPLQGNAYMTEFCTLPQTYPVAALIVVGVFAMGWPAATASFRIAISALVSFALWYGVTSLLYFCIITRWADTPEPAQPEMLAMVLANPWMIAALPGAFFLVYAVLVSFFETFLSKKKKPVAKKDDKKPEEKPADGKKEEKTAAKPASETKSTPVQPKLTVKKTAPAAPKKDEAPKTEEKPAEPKKDEAPKEEDKPVEAKKEKAAETKTEEKPAEAKKDEAPQAEEKPAEEKKA